MNTQNQSIYLYECMCDWILIPDSSKNIWFIQNRWDNIDFVICQKYLIFKTTNFIITETHHDTTAYVVEDNNKQQHTSFVVCPTHLFFLFNKPFVNVTFSIRTHLRYRLQYYPSHYYRFLWRCHICAERLIYGQTKWTEHW